MITGELDILSGDEVLNWLLEPENPSVRYWALRDLQGRPEESPEVVEARDAVMESAPVRAILDAQYPQGYWVAPGVGYSPRHRATLWQILSLAQLGARPTPPVRRACEYALKNAYRTELGLFSAHKTATGTIPCLNGNLLWAYRHLSYGELPEIRRATEALALRMLRDGYRCRYNAAESRKPKTWLPCAWGAVKVLLAFSLVEEEGRMGAVVQAIEVGAELLLSHELVRADYPNARGISPLWFQLGFPLGFTSDLLEALEALTAVGRGDDPSLVEVEGWLLSRRDDLGRWPLDRTLAKTWAKFEAVGRPSKWITLRALRALGSLGAQ